MNNLRNTLLLNHFLQRRLISNIPGTTRLEHLLDNLGAAGVTLSSDLARRAAACMSGIQGARYAPATFAEIDSD